jgi:hypothetical protein
MGRGSYHIVWNFNMFILVWLVLKAIPPTLSESHQFVCSVIGKYQRWPRGVSLKRYEWVWWCCTTSFYKVAGKAVRLHQPEKLGKRRELAH